MTQTICNLCMQHDVKSGKDKLLYEDDFCYIVDNGNTHLGIEDIIMFAQRRVSLIIRNHKGTLDTHETDMVEEILADFMLRELGLQKDRDYFLKSTMGTYPDHYHMHAYVPPFTTEGIIK